MKRLRRGVAAIGMVTVAASGVVAGTAASAAAAPVGNGKNPIVFVHGYSNFGHSGNWDVLKAALKKSGYTDEQLVAINYNNLTQSNVETAKFIGKTVNDVLARTGASKADLISHSMGGINTRYCVKFDACEGKVERWISLAGANHGTYTAYWCWWYNVTCREMVPGSNLLKKLNTAPEAPSGVKWSTIWSPDDGVINPARSTKVDGATNIKMSGLSHMKILTDPGVIDKVKMLLQR